MRVCIIPKLLQNGADLFVTQPAAVIGHNGFESFHRAGPAVIGDKGAHPGTDIQKAAVFQLHDAAIDHRTADPHRLSQLALRGELLSHR